MSGVVENITIEELLDEAVVINSASLVRHKIEVVREYGETPSLKLEKQKVLQVLINLVSNAKYAVMEGDNEVRRVTLRTDSHGKGVRAQVSDTGMGISEEHLARIFAHGFTTRKNGHGFALHNCALTLKEVGGSLSVQSDGPGMGATFTLELPCDRREQPS